MKRVLLVFTVFLFFASANAQDLSEGLKAKNDGNEAYRNQDYVSAISNWEKYLKSGEEGAEADENTKSLYDKSFLLAGETFFKAKEYQKAYDYFDKYTNNVEKDGGVIYKMAYSAIKLDKKDLALSKYQESIAIDYKADICMLYIADIYKDADNEAKMIETLKIAMEKYPDSKSYSKMAKMLSFPMLKEAAIPFNEANELAKEAASSDPTAYLDNMSKAVTKFEEALPLFKKVLEYDAENDQANAYIKNCEDNIKAFNDYKASLEKK